MRSDELGMMNDEFGIADGGDASGHSSFIVHHSSFIVALAGGVGGAKLAYGLYRALGERLAVVVNTGDDCEHWGLTVCPDLDTVMYNLAGINNPEFGWGLAGETQRALAMMQRYGGESWFGLGDGDLATHLLRTQRLRSGLNLTEVTFELKAALGIAAELLPMSDQPVRTVVQTDEGLLPFQRYFVQRRCEPRLLGLEFAGLEAARPSPSVLAALAKASAVVLCPSNPYLSLDPILLLPGLAERLRAFTGPVVAVSPIVGGQALKGPAAKIMAELGRGGVGAGRGPAHRRPHPAGRLCAGHGGCVSGGRGSQPGRHAAGDGHYHARCSQQGTAGAGGVGVGGEHRLIAKRPGEG
jgi:LPPG:FO 2-phospho-L-lactate transferase